MSNPESDGLRKEAMDHFSHLFTEAKKRGIPEPSVMSLATADESGRPSVRTMTVSHFDENGFVFFTNNRSRKGCQLEGRPYAAMCFFWQPLNEQVTVEGFVESVSDAEAEKWWQSRARDNQFAAWASDQSQPLDKRETLQRRLEKCREQFIDGRIPKPSHWRGYRLRPERIEFWRAGWRQLHERICYQDNENGWEKILLNP